MKKKIMIGLGIAVVIIAVALGYLRYRNSSLSPAGQTEVSYNDLSVSIKYGRPSVRGRLIFGAASEKALQPYGVYWRLGANESTEITFNRDVLFNNESVKAGSYKMYAIPQADHFEIVLNSALGTWGYEEPDHSLDIIKTSVSVQHLAVPVEQLTIIALPADKGIDVSFEWSDVKVVIPVRTN